MYGIRTILGSMLLTVALCPTLAWGGKLPVFVTIAPQQYFVDQISGGLADAEPMIEPGADPHTYEPKPRQMARLSNAKLYLAIGMTPFEPVWLKRFAAAAPAMRIVHTEAGIDPIPAPSRHHDTAEHPASTPMEGPKAKAAHNHDGEPDPHFWLSPRAGAVLATNTASALIEMDPANAATYRDRLHTLLSAIDRLDAEIRAILQSVPANRKSFMVFHPNWTYFARDYGLNQIPIEMEGKEPGPAELIALVEQAKQLGVTALFTSPQFSDKSARTIAGEIGAHVVKLDPLGYAWPDSLLTAAKEFRDAMR